MSLQPVLIGEGWCPSAGGDTFRAYNPQTREAWPELFPVSTWSECERALDCAAAAADELRRLPGERLASYLECFAERITARQAELVEMAHRETALPRTPRLADVELPRTVDQMRQAAAAARHGTWRDATIDTRLNIRSCLQGIGPVCVFGPNNFPFAFGSASGGDFVAAIASGNPVIAKANTGHPATTRLFAEEAWQAQRDCGLPAGTIQMFYRLKHADGQRLVSDRRIGATAYTGSRGAGLELKQAADRAGKPIYLELSSVNPVVILPGALRERAPQIVDELVQSALAGAGQFCTNPGLVFLLEGPESAAWIEAVVERYEQASDGTLLSAGVYDSWCTGLEIWKQAGARVLAGDAAGAGGGWSRRNSILSVEAHIFAQQAHLLQTEVFGNATLIVIARDVQQMIAALQQTEGNLTGTIYSDTQGSDDPIYGHVAAVLRPRVGRLINDKMPTGVAVSPAMQHGGPYPATGHPGFTAVGIPASLRRFAALQCYDQVRPARLPEFLRDDYHNPQMWRYVDGRWTLATGP